MFSEILAILSLIIVVIVSFLSLRNMNRYNRWFSNLSQYIGKDEEGHVVMDERIVAFIDAFASRFFQSAKMSMLGNLSGNARLEKGLKEAFTKDMIEEKLPLLNAGAGILEDFTGYNVKKYITKNPDALFQVVGLLQKYGVNLGSLGGKMPSNNPGNRGRM